MLVYPGDPEVRMSPVSAAGDGGAAVSALHLGTHTGTHVDPPAHLYHGAATVDALPLDVLVGPCVVVHLPGDGAITAAELAAAVPAGTKRVLLRTHDGELWAGREVRTDYRGLDAAAADWLVGHGVQLVGIDYLSIDPAEAADLPAHRALLEGGVVVVEGLDLRDAAAGEWGLLCLPLRLAGGDGAPARVVLTRPD